MNAYLTGLLAGLMALLAGCATNPSPTDSPNIILILTDDQTYDAVHALGNAEIQTPNIDRLVNGGTTFTHAYNMGAWGGAVCQASRAMIISGRTVWRANEFRQNWRKGDSLEMTWPKLMEQAGYETYMTGKWHVDAPAQKVFQHTAHIRAGMPKDHWNHGKQKALFDSLKQIGQTEKFLDLMPVGYSRPMSPEDQSWLPTDSAHGGFWKGGKHWSEVLKDDALEYLDSATTRDQPYFMYLAFNAPHDPRQAPQEYLDLYPLENISLPPSYMALNPDQDLIGCGPALRDEALAPFPRTEFAIKTHRREYYALITHMDEQIGKILDAIEASPEADNTYILFTADHGLAVGNHGLVGKQNLYDHSMRVPLMVKGPGVPAGAKIDAPVYLQDIVPTALELAGTEIPEFVEFQSLMPHIRDDQAPRREEIYGGYIGVQRMIQTEGYKLHWYPRAEKIMLFDTHADPYELTDLSGEPSQQARIVQMWELLRAQQEKLGDKLEMPAIEQLM
ncbi:sulfatase-like hydrolase/transferase [Pontibacter sp. G13]|uniref:sulfatase-like hydrolase/transferase n=1 Tax=Pontibacter sp. G13 TaxID=3074898 RepID=UPI0028896320|nr:sulfatase-like hydrolase/transferase [Pontibacter sp. G13]WNJ20065.1 sulfatase-like hydrolase/transferase [Pontibacter sp. G13]